MNNQYDLDQIDLRILEQLQQDARISNIDLAREVGLSPSSCHRRMRMIEEAGLVQQYVTLLNRAAVGLKLTAFVEVALNHKDAKTITAFQQVEIGRASCRERV